MSSPLRIACALVACALWAAWAVRPQDAAGSRPASKPSGPLVVLSGNEHGFIRPCGCSKPALGGVHRRAHAIDELRQAGRTVHPVALGEFIADTGRQQEIKLETFLLSLAEMQYAAFVPGVGEFKLGTRFLSDSKAMVPFPFVLANVTLEGEPVLTPSVRLGEGLLVGLLGPTPPELKVNRSAPADALRRELAATAAPWTMVVYNGPAADLAELAAAVPEERRPSVFFAIPGNGDAPTAQEPVLGMKVVTPGTKGRSIAILRPGAPRFFESLLLEEARPGLPAVNAILDAYRRTIREEGLAKNVPKLPAKVKYVGDQRCVECHADACTKLKISAHQHAMKSLEATHDDHDPECVKCHVTGWATESGFVDQATTPTMMNVNCEACHGPCDVHCQTVAPTLPGKVDADTCVRCHDPDNSPHFEFTKYWPKIEHR